MILCYTTFRAGITAPRRRTWHSTMTVHPSGHRMERMSVLQSTDVKGGRTKLHWATSCSYAPYEAPSCLIQRPKIKDGSGVCSLQFTWLKKPSQDVRDFEIKRNSSLLGVRRKQGFMHEWLRFFTSMYLWGKIRSVYYTEIGCPNTWRLSEWSHRKNEREKRRNAYSANALSHDFGVFIDVSNQLPCGLWRL